MECVKQNYDAFKSNDFRNYWIVLSVASVLLVENTRVPGKKPPTRRRSLSNVNTKGLIESMNRSQ